MGAIGKGVKKFINDTFGGGPPKKPVMTGAQVQSKPPAVTMGNRTKVNAMLREAEREIDSQSTHPNHPRK